jgi:hypothetical protein
MRRFTARVVTLYEPLACYRLHDSNDNLWGTIESARFAHNSRRESFRLHYFAQRCQFWGLPFDPVAVRNHSSFLLECRLAADKLASVKDPTGEPIWRTLCRALKACIDSLLPVSNRIIRASLVCHCRRQPASCREMVDRFSPYYSGAAHVARTVAGHYGQHQQRAWMAAYAAHYKPVKASKHGVSSLPSLTP